MTNIGLLNEKPLHASLKQWYSRPGDQIEVAVDGFVVDLVRDNLLLEIQTRSFSSIKPKVLDMICAHRVRLVYPIAQEKWIVKLPQGSGGQATRRKSPKRGRVEDLFWEMVSFPHLAAHPNFSLEVLLIHEEEVRRYDGRRRRRRGGWVVHERRLLGVIERRLYERPVDWRALLPPGLSTFTVAELANVMGIGSRLAQKMAYCLRKASVTTLIGKQGRAHLYSVDGK